MVKGIEQQISQPSFDEVYEQMESLLIQGLSREAYTAELDYIKAYMTLGGQ